MTNPPIQHLSEHALLKINLQDAQYGVDLALFNDGKDLSAELLKLALAGIAVVGALRSLPDRPWPDDLLFKILLSCSVIAFAASTGTALLQRFFASSALFHHIKAMKMASCDDAAIEQSVEAEVAIRLAQFGRAHVLLIATAALLVSGAALLGSAFIRLMFA
jgi:hypothetical protein